MVNVKRFLRNKMAKVGKKLKILPPTLRGNKRYLLVKSPQTKVEKTLMKFYGEWGWAKASPQFIKANTHLIISIERVFLDPTRIALDLSNIKVLGISGTINKLKSKFLR